MYEAIALLAPSIIGVTIINDKKKLTPKMYVFNFALLVMISNSIMSLIFYLKTKALFMDFTLLFFVKYCMFNSFVNIFLSCIINYIRKNFKFQLRKKV